jgi:hypothetical protein
LLQNDNVACHHWGVWTVVASPDATSHDGLPERSVRVHFPTDRVDKKTLPTLKLSCSNSGHLNKAKGDAGSKFKQILNIFIPLLKKTRCMSHPLSFPCTLFAFQLAALFEEESPKQSLASHLLLCVLEKWTSVMFSKSLK